MTDDTRSPGMKSMPLRWPSQLAVRLTVISVAIQLVGCSPATETVGQAATSVPPAASTADDFLVVDCLLPGQIRRLGQMAVYLAARQAIKTSASDCQIRGGEYVAFDRADRATALRVWLPLAEKGDITAQTYVGEIFEKGVGVPSDYAAAAQWYRRAAESGNSRAAVNLGSLFERGLGVAKDSKQALNWYRRAAGLSDLGFEVVPAAQELKDLRQEVDDLKRQLQAKQAELDRTQRELDTLRRRRDEQSTEANSERAALASLREQLTQQRANEHAATARIRALERSLAERTQQDAAALRQQLAEQRTNEQAAASQLRVLEQSIAEREARLTTKERELADLRVVLAKREAESKTQQAELARLKQEPATEPSQPGRGSQKAAIGLPRPKDISFGTYHALVVGNVEYRELPRLRTATNDAKEVARVLREEYGFQVTLLLNATRYETLSALNTLRERLTSKDNLLIYYAGHGDLDQLNQRGHWLPIDAERTSSANWISNISITDVLNTMSVQQLLVVADSCYSGTLTRSALGRLEPGITPEQRLHLVERMAQQRSRMVMTSGGLEPVVDSVDGKHSAFARVFIRLLEANRGVLAGQELFQLLQLQVVLAAQGLAVRQVPEYAPIKLAGHESGDFFFVRSVAPPRN